MNNATRWTSDSHARPVRNWMIGMSRILTEEALLGDALSPSCGALGDSVPPFRVRWISWRAASHLARA